MRLTYHCHIFLELSGQCTFRVKILGCFIPTLINGVKHIISKFLEAYIQFSYLFRIVRTRPMHLTTFRVNIWGHFINTLINRALLPACGLFCRRHWNQSRMLKHRLSDSLQLNLKTVYY